MAITVTSLGVSQSKFDIPGMNAVDARQWTAGESLIVTYAGDVAATSVTVNGAGAGGEVLTLTKVAEAINTGNVITSVWWGKVLTTTTINRAAFINRTDTGVAQAMATTAYSVSGLDDNAFDKSSVAIGSGTLPSSGQTETLSQANELAIGVVGVEDNVEDIAGAFSTGSIFVSGNDQQDGTSGGGGASNISVRSVAEILSSTTGQYAYISGMASADWAAAVVTFKEATSAVTHEGDASLGATSTETAVGSITLNGDSTLSTTSTLVTVGINYVVGEVTLSGTGDLTVSGGIFQEGESQLLTTSEVIPSGRIALSGETSLDSSSQLIVNSYITLATRLGTVEKTLEDITLESAVSTASTKDGESILLASSSLIPLGLLFINSTTSLTASSATTIQTINYVAGVATLDATSTLSANGELKLNATLNKTLGDVISVSAVESVGYLLDNLTLSSAVTTIISSSGSVVKTLENISPDISASLPVEGVVVVTLDGIQHNLVTNNPVEATLSKSLSDVAVDSVSSVVTIHDAEAILQTQSTQTVVAILYKNVQSTLATLSDATTAGILYKEATSSLQGTTFLTAAGINYVAGVVVLAGTSEQISFGGIIHDAVSGVLASSAGTTAGGIILSASASLDTASELVVETSGTKDASTVLSADSEIISRGELYKNATTIIASDSALTAIPAITLEASTILATLSVLDVAGITYINANSVLGASSTTITDAQITTLHSGESSLVSTSEVVSSGVVYKEGVASLAGNTSLDSAGVVTTTHDATAQLLGTSSLESAGELAARLVLNSTLDDLAITSEASAIGYLLDNLTLSSTVTTVMAGSGVVIKTLGSIGLDASAEVPVEGSGNVVLANTTLSASSETNILASLLKTLSALSATIEGTLSVRGNLNTNLGALAAVSVSDVLVEGVSQKSLGDIDLTASADLKLDGIVQRTLAGLTALISGQITVVGGVGNLVVGLEGVSVDATGNVELSGETQKVLESLGRTLAADVLIESITQRTLGNLTLSSDNIVREPILGSVQLTLSDTVLVSYAQTVTWMQIFEVRAEVDPSLLADALLGVNLTKDILLSLEMIEDNQINISAHFEADVDTQMVRDAGFSLSLVRDVYVSTSDSGDSSVGQLLLYNSPQDPSLDSGMAGDLVLEFDRRYYGR